MFLRPLLRGRVRTERLRLCFEGSGPMDEKDIVICRCEDVTEREVLEAIRRGQHSLDEIKRILRCGMGHCQGRTCARLIAGLLCRELGIMMEQIRWTTFRAPLLPVRLEVLARGDQQLPDSTGEVLAGQGP